MIEQGIAVIYEAFVYRWTNIRTGKIYIGYHKGTPDDGYISSGKAFLIAYNANPHLFIRDILAYGTKANMLQLEQSLIMKHLTSPENKIYNLTCHEYLKTWKRTCLWCGSVVDPRNEEWLHYFEKVHFENCDKNPANEKEWTIIHPEVEKTVIVKKSKPVKQIKTLLGRSKWIINYENAMEDVFYKKAKRDLYWAEYDLGRAMSRPDTSKTILLRERRIEEVEKCKTRLSEIENLRNPK